MNFFNTPAMSPQISDSFRLLKKAIEADQPNDDEWWDQIIDLFREGNYLGTSGLKGKSVVLPSDTAY